MIDVVRNLEGRAVAFVSLTESIDTSAPEGRLIIHVFEAPTKFERDLIRVRTHGRARRRQHAGKTGGRPTLSSTRVPRKPGSDKPVQVAPRARVRATLLPVSQPLADPALYG